MKAPKYTKEDYKIDLLYAFPKYRVLLVELDRLEREIRKLHKNIEYYKKNEIEKNFIIKQKNRTIYKLRKELKDVQRNKKVWKKQIFC